MSGASQILDQYVNKLVDRNATDSGINDTILVRVRAGQTFYLWNSSNVYPDEASVEVEKMEDQDQFGANNVEKTFEKMVEKLFQNDTKEGTERGNPGGLFNNEKHNDNITPPMHFGS